MLHRHFKLISAGLIASASLLAAVQPAFAVGEPQFGNAWIKGTFSGTEGNALPGAGAEMPRFEVIKPADAETFGEIVKDTVTIYGAYYATMKRGYVYDTDIGIEYNGSNVRELRTGLGDPWIPPKTRTGTFKFDVEATSLPPHIKNGIIASCNGSGMSNGQSTFNFPVAMQVKGYRYKLGNTSANKRRDKLVRGFVPVKVFCTSLTHSAANDSPKTVKLIVKKLGAARSCPRRIEVRTRIRYAKPTTAKFRFVHNGKRTALIEIKARKIKADDYLVERVQFYNVDPGSHKFGLRLQGSKNPAPKTIKVGCGPFKPTAMWMTLSQQKKASCTKRVTAKIRIDADQPGSVLTKIKNQAGVVMAIESVKVKREGKQYIGRLTKVFNMGEIDTQLIAESSNDSGLNSGWQPLKVTCLKAVKGTLSFQGKDFGRCPRQVKVAFAIQTSINGNLKYHVACTGGRKWAGKVKAHKTGPDTYIAAGVKSFSIKKHEKVSCALKGGPAGQVKLLTMAGHSFSCDQGASDDLTAQPDPSHDEPSPPAGLIAEPKSCKRNERLINGRCVRIVIDCKRGYKLVNGRCIKQPVKCKRGERRVKGKCIGVVIDCKRGFKLVNGRCIKQPAKCKRGERRVKGRCIKTPISIRCKKGYLRRGNKCVKKPGRVIKCTAGERRVGKRCVCKRGYKQFRGRCIKPAKRVKPKVKIMKLNKKALKRKIRRNKNKARR